MTTSEDIRMTSLVISSNNNSICETTTVQHEHPFSETAAKRRQMIFTLEMPQLVNDRDTDEGRSTSRAPTKQVSILTKQLSALGDQEVNDITLDEAIETPNQLSFD